LADLSTKLRRRLGISTGNQSAPLKSTILSDVVGPITDVDPANSPVVNDQMTTPSLTTPYSMSLTTTSLEDHVLVSSTAVLTTECPAQDADADAPSTSIRKTAHYLISILMSFSTFFVLYNTF
jgi:hypothetical protein